MHKYFSKNSVQQLSPQTNPTLQKLLVLVTHILRLFLIIIMVKQKVVIRVPMNNQKSRSKAMKIAVGVSGVDSATLKEDQLEVIGEGVDSIGLTSLLRKSFGHADLLSVGPVEEKKDEAITQTESWPYVAGVPHYPIYEIGSTGQYHGPYCSIM